MLNHKKTLKIIKLIVFVVTVCLLIYLSIKLFPMFSKLGTDEGRIAFKQQIDDSGFKGGLTIIGIQLLQILIPVLPGEPIELLAGMCYGTFGGLLLIFVGSFLSSFIIFYCVRKLGKSFINTFLGEDKITKLENSKFFANPEKIEFLLFLGFLIPGTPKDLFVYISGLLPIKPSKFFFISTFCRFPSAISSTFAGANLINGNWIMTILSYVITFAICGVGLYIFKLISKNKNNIVNV